MRNVKKVVPAPTAQPKKFLSVKEAQKHFGVSRSYFYQLKREGKLKFYLIGQKPVIKVSEFEKLMQPRPWDKAKRKEVVNA